MRSLNDVSVCFPMVPWCPVGTCSLLACNNAVDPFMHQHDLTQCSFSPDAATMDYGQPSAPFFMFWLVSVRIKARLRYLCKDEWNCWESGLPGCQSLSESLYHPSKGTAKYSVTPGQVHQAFGCRRCRKPASPLCGTQFPGEFWSPMPGGAACEMPILTMFCSM